ncbi:hypothetical protein SODALDRAFT_326257 [Sodiomyces alkalinus F11]|uniref:Uncharacterized protein n=1 Tax=Sodiomyces alkalinus (strain CBS 110278 / VKM F-3762 / F11) TaxID=1314773 RepID=A0A3N2Q5R0_SODAK|nr:hypothetical protein SODALDRAFT_326257 [Sodiomyces alkalinus F11]ROT42092.1 hypothetical protein SODALDRAFT_326257 [Sodiomyces alkalinus F11]
MTVALMQGPLPVSAFAAQSDGLPGFYRAAPRRHMTGLTPCFMTQTQFPFLSNEAVMPARSLSSQHYIDLDVAWLVLPYVFSPSDIHESCPLFYHIACHVVN